MTVSGTAFVERYAAVLPASAVPVASLCRNRLTCDTEEGTKA